MNITAFVKLVESLDESPQGFDMGCWDTCLAARAAQTHKGRWWFAWQRVRLMHDIPKAAAEALEIDEGMRLFLMMCWPATAQFLYHQGNQRIDGALLAIHDYALKHGTAWEYAEFRRRTQEVYERHPQTGVYQDTQIEAIA